MNAFSTTLVLFAFLLANADPKGDKPLVKPTEVRKIYGDGKKHNAFTALARFGGFYWLAFRSGAGHNSAESDLIVLRSADAKTWSEVKRLHILPDNRDPQFLVTEKRLFLYDIAMKGRELTTFVTSTEDGNTWSKPQPVYEPQYILWKPLEFEGKFYATAHKKDEVSGGKGRQVHLIISEDGLTWKKVSTIRAGNWESETTLYFAPDRRAIAFLRQKYGSPQAQVLQAVPPYTKWEAQPALASHFSGHSVHTMRGVTYLFSRTQPTAKTSGQMIYIFAEGKLTPYCELPAGGDCAYAEAVQRDDEMLVSYYSSHEEGTNIYLAVVPLRK